MLLQKCCMMREAALQFFQSSFLAHTGHVWAIRNWTRQSKEHHFLCCEKFNCRLKLVEQEDDHHHLAANLGIIAKKVKWVNMTHWPQLTLHKHWYAFHFLVYFEQPMRSKLFLRYKLESSKKVKFAFQSRTYFLWSCWCIMINIPNYKAEMMAIGTKSVFFSLQGACDTK